MTDIQKFYADVQRAIKHDRADNGGNYDGKRASQTVKKIFARENPDLREVMETLADYWFESRIASSSQCDKEPTPENVDWLGHVLEFFDGDLSDASVFSDGDWQEIKDAINYNAEDIPIGTLQQLMSLMLEKGKLV